MRFLCDTQILIWAVAGSDRLNVRAHSLIVDRANDVLYSTASLWEAAIKARMGTLQVDVAELHGELSRIGMVHLPIAVAHLVVVADMKQVHHLDPFDHLLIAQAMAEKVPLLTADKIVQRYPIDIIKA